MRADIHICTKREQGWYGGRSACLPPMALWDCWLSKYSALQAGYSPGTPVFLSPQRLTF